jgi:uncharacterized protein YbjT (DUF2867 family)
MKQNTILVVGASGTVGSELVRQLKAEGQNVRTMTSKEAKGQDAVHVNLATGEGITKAFEGVDRAFFLSPPGYADQYLMLSPLIQEAKRRGLKKVVLMTAMGANANEASPFRRAEVELEKSGLNYNIIRPNWFMQNFNTFWIQGIRAEGKISLPAGQAKTSFIDSHDISAVAAKLLLSEQWNNRDFDLTGSVAIDHNQVAAELSKATGKQITYQDIDPSILKKGLLGAGIPADYVDLLLMLFGFVREGYTQGITTSVKDILGREPGTFQAYAKTMKSAWV